MYHIEDCMLVMYCSNEGTALLGEHVLLVFFMHNKEIYKTMPSLAAAVILWGNAPVIFSSIAYCDVNALLLAYFNFSKFR